MARCFDYMNYSMMFSFAAKNLIGHSLKLYKSSFSTNLGKYTFSNRVVDEWNILPVDVISSRHNTVLSFKIKLDRYIPRTVGGWYTSRLSFHCGHFVFKLCTQMTYHVKSS